MNSNDIRSKYLAYFKERQHTIIPSDSLVPKNDPTTLFTGSGMQPLVPYLLGEKHPEGTRLVNSQKCFRSMDIEEVGDNRHTTFFEMLGNWSLGDYFKQEQLPWIFSFLTDELGLDPRRLYVTVFAGDEKNNLPRDDESVEIWKKLFAQKNIDAKAVLIGSESDGYKLGMQEGRIFYYDGKKNWWSRAGEPTNMPAGEPGGPDSEIFYDFGIEHDASWGEHCHPNCDCGRFLEIANSVFMQYLKNDDGSFSLLPKQNVDFGGGLERMEAAIINDPDVFQIDIFKNVITKMEELTGRHYQSDEQTTKAFRVVADHIRAAVFLIGDGLVPGNKDQAYFVRRLIRRATFKMYRLGKYGAAWAKDICAVYIASYSSAYPELKDKETYIIEEIVKEVDHFNQRLLNGVKVFEKMRMQDKRVENVEVQYDWNTFSAHDAFQLYTTYGYPTELSVEIALERNMQFEDGFAHKLEQLLVEHQDLSRAGSEQKFKGGLADASEATTRLHTAHHLLLKALQQVLGEHVHQRGSNITAERLRIDFSHPEKVTPEQLKEVEAIVNQAIADDLPVIRTVMPKDQAETLGAEHEFGAKYPDQVSVYSIGPTQASEEDPKFTEAFSIEFCGGPHMTNTSELGTFKILKEEASSSGVRRIKATLS